MSARRLAVGAKVGALTLLRHGFDDLWACQCDCGNKVIKSTDALRDLRTSHRCGKCRTRRPWTRDPSKERSTVERSLEEVATPARLRAALRGRVLDTRGLLAELGIHCGKAGLAAAAHWLRTHGCKKTLVGGRNAWEWVGVEERTESARPSGPCLEVGTGAKRECSRYEGCLVAFLKAHPNSTSARCPATCAFFAPIERSRLLRKACEDVSYSLRGANLGGAA